jgi:hypothetical protein
MAQLALLLPAAGTAATVASTAAPTFLGMTAATWGGISAGVGALGAIQSGNAQKSAYEQQARATEQASKDRELQRLQNLRRAQSSQRAYWAGSGISAGSGSPATIAQQSRLGYQLERGADISSTGREIQRLQTAGSAAQSAGWFKAAGSAANYGASV